VSMYPYGGLVVSAKDRAKQSFKAECDINNITKRYLETGMVSHLAKGVPSFADVSEAGTLREILDRVRAAGEWFSHLPAAVRAAFGNDPATFVDEMNSPSSRSKLEELGLIPKEAAGPPVVAPAASTVST